MDWPYFYLSGLVGGAGLGFLVGFFWQDRQS